MNFSDTFSANSGLDDPFGMTSFSSAPAKGLELTAGLAMAGAEENEVIPNGSSNPELALKVSLKYKTNVNFSFQK